MPNPPRRIAFITAATDHGTLITNRFDRVMVNANEGFGVGLELLEHSSFDLSEVSLMLQVLELRRRCYGDGVMAVDCGANIGVHTVEWAKRMATWGKVLAIEAQERIFYALAGNIAINNCFNARAINAAVSNETGMMKIPAPNYLMPGSFGSLELKKRDKTENIGQAIDYSESKMIPVQTVTLDSLNLGRIDLIKIDIEGMEMEALEGGSRCIESQHPIILIETIKSDKNALRAWLESRNYRIAEAGINFLAVHKDDKGLPLLNINKPAAPGTPAA